MPKVVAIIESQGFRVDWQPRIVTAADIAGADLVVSVGCDPGTIPTPKPITEWNVPMLSDDFDGSVNAIYRKAEALADELTSSV